MGANVIEKVSHLVERILQTGWAVNLDLPDERFGPTKEAFDVAVAPGGRKPECADDECRPTSGRS